MQIPGHIDPHTVPRAITPREDGRVDLIASDHSPSDPSLKVAGDFRASWGGVAGVQSTLAVLLERGLDGRRLRFEHISALIAANPAARAVVR